MQLVPTRSSSPCAGSALRRRALSLVRLTLVCAPVALIGCRDPKITNYRVPKDEPTEPAAVAQAAGATPQGTMPTDAVHAGLAAGGAPMAAAPAASGPMTMDTAVGSDLAWTAPAGWQSKPASMMRKATFAIVTADGAAAELAITAFPGDVGGEIANVNRWRGQVGLAPLSEADAAAAITRLEANGLKIGVVDLAGPSTHLLGAMVPYGGATWFFKLTGPDAAVAPTKAAYLEFLATVKPAQPATP